MTQPVLPPGMTLRDYFALNVDISQYNPYLTLTQTLGRSPNVREMADWIADVRYVEADAMMRMRETSDDVDPGEEYETETREVALFEEDGYTHVMDVGEEVGCATQISDSVNVKFTLRKDTDDPDAT